MAATYKRLKQEQQELANVESGASSGAPLEVKKNKQRVLVLASRGITQRYRHLMEDVLTLLPHSVKESKFDQVILDTSAMFSSALNHHSETRSSSHK
jgi:ribosome biogenesis protein BRX1